MSFSQELECFDFVFKRVSSEEIESWFSKTTSVHQQVICTELMMHVPACALHTQCPSAFLEPLPAPRGPDVPACLIQNVLCSSMFGSLWFPLTTNSASCTYVTKPSVGAKSSLKPDQSWNAHGRIQWSLLDPGTPSDSTLGHPFMNGVGELPMRNGWTVKGPAFGMSVVGAVSAPADSRSPQFVMHTLLSTGMHRTHCCFMYLHRDDLTVAKMNSQVSASGARRVRLTKH